MVETAICMLLFVVLLNNLENQFFLPKLNFYWWPRRRNNINRTTSRGIAQPILASYWVVIQFCQLSPLQMMSWEINRLWHQNHAFVSYRNNSLCIWNWFFVNNLFGDTTNKPSKEAKVLFHIWHQQTTNQQKSA